MLGHVLFEPVEGQPHKTHITLTHRGFGLDAKWDWSIHHFCDQAWPLVLQQLGNYRREGESPE